MFTTRFERLKELLVKKTTQRDWNFERFAGKIVSSHPRPALPVFITSLERSYSARRPSQGFPEHNVVLYTLLVRNGSNATPESEMVYTIARIRDGVHHRQNPRWGDGTSHTVTYSLISQKVFIKSFCRSQFSHKSGNFSFIITYTKDVLTDLCGS